MDSVKDYVEMVKAPWGRMFYDVLFGQLDIPRTPACDILDFGSGLGVTANHLAAWHNVTAVEPNGEMIGSSYRENGYTQVQGGLEALADYRDGEFDYILCHNVLEYIEDKEPVFAELMRLLKSGGTLSIVKHNRAGRVFGAAVFANDPQNALALLDDHANAQNNYLGKQYIYSNDDVEAWADQYGGKAYRTLGIRTFWALGQDNAVKYKEDWYRDMLDLERRVSDMEAYKAVAFFNHLFIKKL